MVIDGFNNNNNCTATGTAICYFTCDTCHYNSPYDYPIYTEINNYIMDEDPREVARQENNARMVIFNRKDSTIKRKLKYKPHNEFRYIPLVVARNRINNGVRNYKKESR